MSEEKSRRDWWDFIIAQIFVPLLVLGVGYYLNTRLTAIDHKLNTQKQDIAILQEFQKTYADENTRLLSLRYLNLLSNYSTQYQTRNFVTWDLLRQTVKKPENLHKPYMFDHNTDDCYYISINFTEWSNVKPHGLDDSTQLFKTLIIDGPKHYKDYSSKKQYYLLLNWLLNNNPEIRNRLPKDSLEMLNKD